MSLDSLHQDLLSEVFNLGAGRAAASLAELLGNGVEIELSVPQLEIISLGGMASRIQQDDQDPYCGISLEHSGDLCGTSILVYSQEESLRLVALLMGGMGGDLGESSEFTDMHEDALLEVGNLVLNACLSSVANFLSVEFEANVPTIRSGSCERILTHNGTHPLEQLVLYVRIAFGISDEGLDGHIGLCLDIEAMEALTTHLDHFLDNQLGA